MIPESYMVSFGKRNGRRIYSCLVDWCRSTNLTMDQAALMIGAAKDIHLLFPSLVDASRGDEDSLVIIPRWELFSVFKDRFPGGNNLDLLLKRDEEATNDGRVQCLCLLNGEAAFALVTLVPEDPQHDMDILPCQLQRNIN